MARRHKFLACLLIHALLILRSFGDSSCNMREGKLADKVVIVTGATSGIGRVTAIEAAKEGAKVVLTGRRESKGQLVVDEIKASGGEAIFVKTDVGKEKDVKAMVDKTLEVYGRLDGAFNNAGWASFQSIFDFETETFDDMFDTNVKGVMLCTKYEAEAMKLNGDQGGSIVNHASIAAKRGYPGIGIYGPTKAAVWHFSNVAAAELGPSNIRVNTINTGLIPDTEIFEKVTGGDAAAKEDFMAKRVPEIPMGRTGFPIEIAQPVIFFLSDMASYVTGSQITADGGRTL